MLKKIIASLLLLFIPVSVYAQSSDISGKSDVVVIYISDNCEECKNLEKYVRDNDLQRSVDFRNIRDSQYSSQLQKFFEENDVKTSDRDTPFMVNNEAFKYGEENIKNELAKIGNIKTDENLQSNTSTKSSGKSDKTALYYILGGLGILIVLGVLSNVIKEANKDDEEEDAEEEDETDDDKVEFSGKNDKNEKVENELADKK